MQKLEEGQIEEQSSFQKFKVKMFDFTQQLVNNELHVYAYIALVIIQNLQILSFQQNNLLPYNTVGLQQISVVTKYLNLQYFLSVQNINQFIVPLFTGVVVLHALLIFMGFQAYQSKISKMQTSIQNRNFHKNRIQYFINIGVILFNTIFTIPIFQTSINAIYCTNDNPFSNSQDCYSSTQIVIIILAVVNILWLFFNSFYYTLYYYNRNPFSIHFHTCSSHWWNLGKFCAKLFPAAYLIYDPIIQYQIIFICGCPIIYFVYLLLFRSIFSYHRYNFKLDCTIMQIECTSCCLLFCFPLLWVFENNFNSHNLNYFLIYWFLISFVLALGIVKIYRNLKQQLVHDLQQIQKQKLQSVHEYLIYAIYRAQTQTNLKKKYFSILPIAKLHRQKCKNTQCICNQFRSAYKNDKSNKDLTIFYLLILAIIDRVIAENKKAYSFYILKSYILYYRLKSEIKAATTISKIMNDKLDFSDKMLVKGLLFELKQQYNDTRDMQIYRKFNQHLRQQEQESYKLVINYLDYWEELLNRDSYLPKLFNLIKKIKTSKILIQGIVSSALKIFPSHVRVILLYKTLLKQVQNEYLEYLKYEQQYKMGLKLNRLTNIDAANTIQFRPNQNLLVINFTKNYSNESDIVGSYKIISISSNVKEFLGFSSNQLKNQSLNKLIPRLYHTVHDFFIDRVLNKSDAEIKSNQIRIFPINSKGHIIQCNIISKYMPSQNYGINITSFIEECDKQKDQFFILYDGITGLVDCMNQGAEQILKDAKGRKVDSMLVSDHINDLLPNWDFREQKWRINSKNRSLKSIASNNDLRYDVKNIKIQRSDGLEVKNIKILKFRGEYFATMFSMDDGTFKQSNTIRQYLENQKNSISSDFKEMDSGQLQQFIKIQTQKQFDHQKLQIKKMAPDQQSSKYILPLQIHSQIPKKSKNIFFISQIIILIFALCISGFEFIIEKNNSTQYYADTNLMISANKIQNFISDTTYITSLVVVLEAYTNSTLELPYSNYVPIIDQSIELQELQEDIQQMQQVLNSIILKLTQMYTNQLSSDILNVNIEFQSDPNSKLSYIKTISLITATYQYISYLNDVALKLSKNQPLQILTLSASYQFIINNIIKEFPDKFIHLKNSILNVINNNFSNSLNQFYLYQIFNGCLIVAGTLILFAYTYYFYKNTVWKILSFYQNIKINQIERYFKKCSRYKISLSSRQLQVKLKQTKRRNNILESQLIKQASQTLVNTINVDAQGNIQDNQDQQLIKKNTEIQGQQNYLSFDSVPNLKSYLCRLLAWFIIYIVISFASSYYHQVTTTDLQKRIITLSKYTQLQNSVISFRLYTQMSLNFINQWNQNSIKDINKKVNQHLFIINSLINDTNLNLIEIKSQLYSKIHELTLIQSAVMTKQFNFLNQNAAKISFQLESADQIVDFFQSQIQTQTSNFLYFSNSSSNNIQVIFTIIVVFDLIFWFFFIHYSYKQIKKLHETMYQMFNLIDFNLKKQIESGYNNDFH